MVGSPPHLWGQGGNEVKGSKGYIIVGFRVPTTSVGARGSNGGEQVRGSKRYVIPGFSVPTTSVGAKVCYTRFYGPTASGVRGTRPPSLTEAPRLLKAS